VIGSYLLSRQSNSFESLNNVRFYLDGVLTDSLDAAGISRRNSELISLRPHLMRLNDYEFETTIKAIKGLVLGTLQAAEKSGQNQTPSYRDSRVLYEETRPQISGSLSKVSEV